MRSTRAAPAAQREDGQALVEYALVLALITVVAVVSLALLGGNVNALLDAIANAVAAIPRP